MTHKIAELTFKSKRKQEKENKKGRLVTQQPTILTSYDTECHPKTI